MALIRKKTFASLCIGVSLLAALLVLAGCTARAARVSPNYASEKSDYDEPEPSSEPSSERTKSKRLREYQRDRDDVSRPESPPPPAPPKGDAEHQSASPTERPAGRMVHYDGAIRQRATDPGAVIDSAIRFIRSLGGDVRSRDNSRVTLRVPVEKFRMAFDSLLKFAEVLEKSISASDITESFRDKELRVKIAKATIERLKSILAKTEKEEDKIRLLDEIKRVSEILERLEFERRELLAAADFSTIGLEVVQHHPDADNYAKNELDGFRWIHQLNPLSREWRAGERYLKFRVPAGMVMVERRSNLWRAGSADGAEFWSSRRDNNPAGETDFWFTSIGQRIADGFQTVDTIVAGNFKMLRFLSHGAEPYVYLVGVRALPEELHLVEAYFPSVKQEERYKKEIVEAIAGGAL